MSSNIIEPQLGLSPSRSETPSWGGTLVHRSNHRPPVGHAGDDHAFCALYRRDHLRDIPTGPGSCRRSWLDDDPYDSSALPNYGATRRTGNRTLSSLRPEHGPFPSGRYHLRYFLDMALGTNRFDSRYPTYNVSCGTGSAYRSAQIPSR
jgi:hypothetical protein